MTDPKTYIAALRELIARDELDAVLARLRELLSHSPKLDEVLHQAGRFKQIHQQIRLGTVAHAEADLTRNQIRAALLELINEIEYSIDTTSLPNKPDGLRQGWLLYHIPHRMTVLQETRCIVRIALNQNILKEDLETTEHTNERLLKKISRSMQIELIDPTDNQSFSIRTTSKKIQTIDFDGEEYTEWRYYITPLKEGLYYLEIKASIFEIIDGKKELRERVFDEKVEVVSYKVSDESPNPFKNTGTTFSFISDSGNKSHKAILHEEMEQAISITHSKNVVSGSSISAVGNVHFGDSYHHYGDKKLPRLLTTPPFNSQHFIGRGEDLERIEADYQQNNRLLLLVNGEGGIGKTTLAAKYWYAHEARYKYLAWLYAEAGIGTALLTLKEVLGVAFEPGDNLSTQMQRMAHALSNLEAPCLLVLDNANDAADLEKYYTLLNRLSNCHILLTSRVRKLADMRVHAVQPLSEADTLQLFRTHYPKLAEAELPLLQDILHAVGYNTLVTEVLAKNMAAINRYALHYTLDDLLADLQEKGLLALKNKTVRVVYGSDTLREAKPTEIIAAMYDLAALDDAERYLLSNLAVLPAESIPFTLLATLLATDADTLEGPLYSLETKGWIEHENPDDSSFKISPVIQEITKAKNADRLLADCRSLVNTLRAGLNENNRHTDNYLQANIFARMGTAVIQSLPTHEVIMLCKNISDYHRDTGNLSSMMQIYQKMLDTQIVLCTAQPDNVDFKNGLAILYAKLGEIHSELGDLDKALKLFEERNELSKALYTAHPQNVTYKRGLAISYEKLGQIHSNLGNLSLALPFFEEETKLFKELHETYPQNPNFKDGLAISYQFLGQTYCALGNSPQTLAFFEQYNDLATTLYNSDPQNPNFKDGLAISYQFLGQTHRTDDLNLALTFFEKYNDLEKELHESYPQNVDFKNNLASSYSKLGSTHTALGNLTLALTFFEDETTLFKELHEAYPQNVSFKNGLAISYAQLGVFSQDQLKDKQKAKVYFQQAEALWVELAQDAPGYVQFQQYLSMARDVLSSLDE